MLDISIIGRSYDLRGIYPTEIDEEFYYLFGRSFGTWVRGKSIALWYDARNSSPSLQHAFGQWIMDSGKKLISLWLCSSDMTSFSTGYYNDIDAAVMITASHNPKDYNGMKASLKWWIPVNLKEIWPILIDWIHQYNTSPIPPIQWEYEERQILDDWVNHILSFSHTKNFGKISLIADAWNGTAWVFMDALTKKAGWNLTPLFFDPDGNFPNHHPNPVLEENRKDCRKKIQETKSDIWLIFDGDADRVVILDENGDNISPSIICAIIAHKILVENPWAGICGNAVTSKIVQDITLENGGKYTRQKVWHVYIKEEMSKDSSILFAWEWSAHYFFQKNWNADSGIIAAIIFLDILSQSWKKTSELIEVYTRYKTLEETNFKVANPKWLIEKLAENFSELKQDRLDGLTVYYPYGWWNVRPSSNEPLLRLNLETETKEQFDILYEKLVNFIESNSL